MDRLRRRAVGAPGTAIAVGTLVAACTPDDVTRVPTLVVAEPLAARQVLRA